MLSESQPITMNGLVSDLRLLSSDAGALLLACTLPSTNLLAVNINYPSSYSALAASAILSYYGHSAVPIGLRRPVTNASFFDAYYYDLGEYASKVAYHWSGGRMPWEEIQNMWDPVELYRKTLASYADNSVTIASLGFLENVFKIVPQLPSITDTLQLSGLLNSTADKYSPLSGPDLVAAKVSELVVMGGGYPNGHEYNFFGDNPSATAHVINSWPGCIVFSGTELGASVLSGARFAVSVQDNDPVAAAYQWYVGYNNSRESWDPLTVLYAVQGLGNHFEYGGDSGFNYVWPNGSNTWVWDESRTSQHWLQLKVDNTTMAANLDDLYLKGSRVVRE